MTAPRVLVWDDLAVGQSVSATFSISAQDLETFAELSGDRSRIHFDRAFARANGFAGPVVHGALVVAKLSFLVGMRLPGDLGLATSWRLNFHSPLYVGETAAIEGTLSHKSEATHTVKLKVRVESGDRLIADGTAEAKLLDR